MAVTLKTVGIIVTNMAKTLAFYRALGLNIPHHADEEPNVDFEAPNGIVLGFLNEEVARHADPDYQQPNGQSLNLQFAADSPAEVDAIYNNLIAAGYESYAEPWDSFWGQRFARVKDPDGRIVNIYAYLV